MPAQQRPGKPRIKDGLHEAFDQPLLQLLPPFALIERSLADARKIDPFQVVGQVVVEHAEPGRNAAQHGLVEACKLVGRKLRRPFAQLGASRQKHELAGLRLQRHVHRRVLVVLRTEAITPLECAHLGRAHARIDDGRILEARELAHPEKPSRHPRQPSFLPRELGQEAVDDLAGWNAQAVTPAVAVTIGVLALVISKVVRQRPAILVEFDAGTNEPPSGQVVFVMLRIAALRVEHLQRDAKRACVGTENHAKHELAVDHS